MILFPTIVAEGTIEESIMSTLMINFILLGRQKKGQVGSAKAPAPLETTNASPELRCRLKRMSALGASKRCEAFSNSCHELTMSGR